MDDTGGLFPPLDPERKASMSLDEIIQYEKNRDAYRHQVNGKNQRHFRFKKRRRFNRFWRRYPSQNWRLGGNGPGPYRRRYRNKWKEQVNSERMGKVRAFLQRKWLNTPTNSVFHRLGWNPTQSVALSKLYSARYFRRPSQFWSRFKKNGFKIQPYCPDRLQRMKASARFYSRNDGLSNVPDTPTAALTNENLQRLSDALSEALGESVTDVQRSQTDDGSVLTIRTSDSIPKLLSGFRNQPMSGFNDVNDSYNASNFRSAQNYNTTPDFSSAQNYNTAPDFRSAQNYNTAPDYTSPLNRISNSSLNSVSSYNLRPDFRSPLLPRSNSNSSIATNLTSMSGINYLPFNTPNHGSLAMNYQQNNPQGELVIRVPNESRGANGQNAYHQNNPNYSEMPPLVSSRNQFYVQTTNLPCSARFSAINPPSQGFQSMEQ